MAHNQSAYSAKLISRSEELRFGNEAMRDHLLYLSRFYAMSLNGTKINLFNHNDVSDVSTFLRLADSCQNLESCLPYVWTPV